MVSTKPLKNTERPWILQNWTRHETKSSANSDLSLPKYHDEW